MTNCRHNNNTIIKSNISCLNIDSIIYKLIRFILKTLLEKNKYSVATTGNQVGLLRLIKEISPDLLITDVKLPDGNILDSLSQIKYLTFFNLRNFFGLFVDRLVTKKFLFKHCKAK